MWSIKHRPSRVEEMVGNEYARIEFVKWLLTWRVGVKPILLLGPPGIGKTTLVKATASQFQFDLIELNASDKRTKERLEEIIKPLLENASILGRKILLFLDEVDGIHGNADRGGLATLISFAKEASIPIVMAANVEDDNIKELGRFCRVIRFKEIPPRLMQLYLEHILRKEGISIDIDSKIEIVKHNNNDIRSMLNAASANILLSSKGEEQESSLDIAIAINRFFNAKDVNDAVEALRYAEGFYYDPRFASDKHLDKLEALFASIVNNTSDIDMLAEMLNILSCIDMLIGRMNNTREWRMLRYIDYILANSLFKYTRGFTYHQYSIPYALANRIFTDGRVINRFNSILAKALHTSRREIALSLPYLLLILKPRMKEFLEANSIDRSIASTLEAEMEGLKK